MSTFFDKTALCLLETPKQISILAISNDCFFSKTHGTRLYARITPKKDLKQALLSKFSFNINFHIYLIYLSFAYFLIYYCSLPLVLNTRTLY